MTRALGYDNQTFSVSKVMLICSGHIWGLGTVTNVIDRLGMPVCGRVIVLLDVDVLVFPNFDRIVTVTEIEIIKPIKNVMNFVTMPG